MRSTVAIHLPPHLADDLAAGLAASAPAVVRRHAAMLLADIAGFTAMTERLSAKGREGAEEVAAIVNGAFAAAIRDIARAGGSVVGFGGDALFVIFPGTSGARRALAVAESFRRTLGRRTFAARVELSLSQAVHFGEVVDLHLGSEHRRHLLVGGAAIRALARLEARAAAGQILVSPAARARIATEPEPASESAGTARRSPPLLAAYVDPRLRSQLVDFAGAYRRAAVLFLESAGHHVGRLQRWYLSLAEVLGRHEGVLLKSDLSPHGSKWLAVFGVPATHEDDPARAADAAAELLARTPSGLRVRGGLHVGVVANLLVGAAERRVVDVIGDAVNTAARALARASWGEVLLTEETRRLLPGARTTERGRHAVKGKVEELHLHALMGSRRSSKPLVVAGPLLGRDVERGRLAAALDRAREGAGGALGLCGEAGVGKSRLAWESARDARRMGFAVHEGRATSLAGVAYVAMGGLVRDALGLPEDAAGEAVRASVAEAARRLGLDEADRRHLPELLGAREPGSAISRLDPAVARANNAIAARNLFRALAREGPRLLVLEDMHWCDGATRSAMAPLVRAATDARLLLLLLYRPGFEPPAGVEQVALGELHDGPMRELVGAAAPGAAGDDVAAIVERAGGNPFYLEELIRHLLESGLLLGEGQRRRAGIPLGELPSSVEGVIAARLDRLGRGARRTAQHGAVIGRRFPMALLARLPGMGVAAAPGVAELCLHDITRESHAPPRSEYAFTHALTRDVAYASMLVARRRTVHRAVADALESDGADDAVLPVLAHHREAAGQTSRARPAYLAAARRAVRAFAHEEAEYLYRKYLALAPDASSERAAARWELAKDLSLQGRWNDTEREVAALREEASRLGSEILEGESLMLLGEVQRGRGALEPALSHYRGAHAIFERKGTGRHVAGALSNIAIVSAMRSKSQEALAVLEEALLHHRRNADERHEALALNTRGNVLQELGRLEEALASYEQALELARLSGHPGDEGLVLGNMGVLAFAQGRTTEARRHLEGALARHRETGERQRQGAVLGNLGLLHASEGRPEDARSAYEACIAIQRDAGARVWEALAERGLGDLLLQAGRLAEAAAAAARAVAILRETGPIRDLALALDLQGNVALAQGHLEEARGRLEEALASHRQAGFRRGEGATAGILAVVEILDGRLERALELLDRGEQLLRSAGTPADLCLLLVRRGHLALALGSSAVPLLDEARGLVGGLGRTEGSPLVAAVTRLERAERARDRGDELVRGHRRADLTEGQRRWLDARPS